MTAFCFNLRGLSALRLCVWLLNNYYIQFFDIDKGFLSAFRTEKRKVLQFGVFPYLYSRFVFADGTAYKFFVLRHINDIVTFHCFADSLRLESGVYFLAVSASNIPQTQTKA